MASRNVTVCAGVSGFGKSTFALRYLVNAPLAVRYMFDPEPGEFNPDVGEFADRLGLAPATNGYELDKALCQGWVAFDPNQLYAGRNEEAFAFFCDWAWETANKIPGEKILVVDEVWMYCNPQGIPFELKRIVQSGRKSRRLRLMVTTQEPNKLNSSIINGVSEIVCFKLQSNPALELAEKTWGLKREEVSALQPLEFIGKNCDSGGELRGRIKL